MNDLYQCFGKKKTSSEWKPILFGGLNFYADEETIKDNMNLMETYFPMNEYKMVKMNDKPE